MKKTIKAACAIAMLVLAATFTVYVHQGCTSKQDACKAFCLKAAECLQCGSTANLERCQDTCYDLSIEDSKSLSDCTNDCMVMRTCPVMIQNPDLNPCRP